MRLYHSSHGHPHLERSLLERLDPDLAIHGQITFYTLTGTTHRRTYFIGN